MSTTGRSANAAHDRSPTAGRILRRGLRRQGRTLAGGFTLYSLWQLCETLVPVVIGVVIDQGIATQDASGFAWSATLLVLLMVTLSVSGRYGMRLCARAAEQEAHALRGEIAAHRLAPEGLRTDLSDGEVLSLATADAHLVGEFIRQIAYAVASAVAVLVVAAYLLSIDLTIALVLLVGVPAVVAASQALTPLVARRTERQQDAIARATGMATDLVAGLRPLKGVHAESTASRRYRAVSAVARDATIGTAGARGALRGLTVGLGGLYIALVAVLVGRAALRGDLSLGQFVAIVGLAQFLGEPINSLGTVSARAATSYAAAGRIARLLRCPPSLTAGSRRPDPTAPALVLAGAGHGPLRSLDLEAVPGGLVAVVTDDGAVARAVLDLVEGRVRPERGHVLLGGAPLHETPIADRRALLLVDPHGSTLFEGTIGEAIDPDGTLTVDERHTALEAAHADDLARDHRLGLDRPVTSGGLNLSGGQRQRLALARALAHARPVLVLHDPTTAVDAVTERALATRLHAAQRRRGGATVAVTTSPALCAVADEVVVLVGGREAARGPHSDLVRDETYAALVLR